MSDIFSNVYALIEHMSSRVTGVLLSISFPSFAHFIGPPLSGGYCAIFAIMSSLITHLCWYFVPDLTEKLDDFIQCETNKLHDENAAEVLKNVRSGEVDVDKLTKAWEKVFTQVSRPGKKLSCLRTIA